ncbi:MAG: helix-turn-helix transcriptional regulator [Kineosporiaceae bacterium]
MAAPAHRTERLLNLVICLLSTRSWLTKEQIRSAVPQYDECATDEAFDRMFERDKEDLRELGIPIVMGSHSAWFEDEQGYRIDRGAYALPDLAFTAQELAVLGLASRVWQQASLAGPAARALVKLKALGVETDEESLVGVEPRVRAAEPAFEPLYAATRDRAPVTFAYRSRDGELTTRHLEPWALTSRGGRWYVVGHDRDRQARRSFRLARIEGEVRRMGPQHAYEVPDDVDPGELVTQWPESQDGRTAVLRVRAGRAVLLRQRAIGAERATDEGWDVVRVAVRDAGELAREVAGYGPDVIALAPPDLRATVVRVLTAALATAGPDGSAGAPTAAEPQPAGRGAP